MSDAPVSTFLMTLIMPNAWYVLHTEEVHLAG